MAKLHITTAINGEPEEFLCDPGETMLDVLRNKLGLTGSKEGCSTGIAAPARSRSTVRWSVPA